MSEYTYRSFNHNYKQINKSELVLLDNTIQTMLLLLTISVYDYGKYMAGIKYCIKLLKFRQNLKEFSLILVCVHLFDG